MIGERLMALARATDSAIELLRGASRLENVATSVLQRLAEAAGCDWASYWAVNPRLRASDPIALWSGLGVQGQPLERAIRTRCMSLNLGNVARVWRNGKPAWSADLMLDMGLPRSLLASQAGLRGGVWFAVKTDTAIYGVVVLLARVQPVIALETLVALERVGFRLGYVLENLRNDEASSRLH